MVLKSLHVYHLAYINVYEVVLLKKLCDKIIEKQKLRKEMMDLGLISTVMGPTGPTGALFKSKNNNYSFKPLFSL